MLVILVLAFCLNLGNRKTKQSAPFSFPILVVAVVFCAYSKSILSAHLKGPWKGKLVCCREGVIWVEQTSLSQTLHLMQVIRWGGEKPDLWLACLFLYVSWCLDKGQISIFFLEFLPEFFWGVFQANIYWARKGTEEGGWGAETG